MRARLIPVIALLLVAAAPLAAQAPGGGGTAVAQTGGDVVRPGDVIKLRIWQEPELSGEFPVSEDGTVVLPKLGPLSVGGASQEQLRERLMAGYATYLQHTSIEITLLRRIQVLGAVRNPGLYPVDGTMTVADVLALAGGVAADGRKNQAQLIRDGRRIDVRLTGAERLADTPIRSGDQLFVEQRSWADRNTGTLVGIVSTTIGLMVALLTR